MAELEQLTHRPSSFRSVRRLARNAQWYSFRSWYVRWSFLGFAAFLVLAIRTGASLVGLRFLCLDGGLPPEFCGFGSLKVNSKVPPIVRVCGGTAKVAPHAPVPEGLSPRLRGNRWRTSIMRLPAGLSPRLRGNPPTPASRRANLRSIPAPAGEPDTSEKRHSHSGVYPRACGGTFDLDVATPFVDGLSPRLRGNLRP